MSNTTLDFIGTIKGVKVNTPSNGYSPASADVTITVEAPKTPNEPHKPDWQIERAQDVIDEFGGERPDDDKDAKRYDKAVAEIEAIKKRYAAQLERHQKQLEGVGGRLMSYAQLVGVMSVFGGKKLHVQLSPAGQDLLPGFEVQLLEDSESDEDDLL